VAVDLLRRLCFPPLLAYILVVSNELLLFCVHRYDRSPVGQSLANLLIDMLKLRVPIRVITPLFGLPIALKTVAHLTQKLATFSWQTGWCWAVSSVASTRVLLLVQRKGDSGSPRAKGSTSPSSVRGKSGSIIRRVGRPPPGRRVRPFPVEDC